MTLPTIVLGIVLSTIYGTAFHFLRGGSLRRLFLFVILSWVGFWTGHFVGGALGWRFASAGQINAGMATLGSVIFLVVGEWLSKVEVKKK
jgi:hypothetical protein